jgi:hypothetical protein
MLEAGNIAMELALRVDGLVPQLFPAARRQGNYWHVGSLMGEPGGSLYVHRYGPRAGKWSDAATGEHGDMIDLVRATQNMDLRAALDWADGWLGNAKVMLSPRRGFGPAPGPRPDLHADEIARLQAASEIWKASRPIAGTIAETYLRNRAITGPLPRSLRFHPSLTHRLSGYAWPALIGGIQDADGHLTAVQRIWIARDGSGKADIDNCKMTLGPMQGGAVRLAPAGRTLGIAEGIETALSAINLFCLPVWACLGVTRMSAVTLPDCVESVILFADQGEAGLAGAEKAAEHYRRMDVTVSIEIPEQDADFNDMAQRAKRAA